MENEKRVIFPEGKISKSDLENIKRPSKNELVEILNTHKSNVKKIQQLNDYYSTEENTLAGKEAYRDLKDTVIRVKTAEPFLRLLGQGNIVDKLNEAFLEGIEIDIIAGIDLRIA